MSGGEQPSVECRGLGGVGWGDSRLNKGLSRTKGAVPSGDRVGMALREFGPKRCVHQDSKVGQVSFA